MGRAGADEGGFTLSKWLLSAGAASRAACDGACAGNTGDDDDTRRPLRFDRAQGPPEFHPERHRHARRRPACREPGRHRRSARHGRDQSGAACKRTKPDATDSAATTPEVAATRAPRRAAPKPPPFNPHAAARCPSRSVQHREPSSSRRRLPCRPSAPAARAAPPRRPPRWISRRRPARSRRNTGSRSRRGCWPRSRWV